jgi:hypothetical protein
MIKRSRTELKNIFSKGKIPEERDFHDLIESMVNLSDERLAGNPGGGIILFNGPESNLLQFYDSPEAKAPTWYFRRKNPLGHEGLDIGESIWHEGERQLLPRSRFFIRHAGGVGINTAQPHHALDVNGDVAMQNRVGTYATGTMPADGQWRNILPADKRSGPKNYFALEVVAHTLSNSGSSHHAVTHAVCIGAYPKGTRGLKRLFGINNTKGIRVTAYYYSKRGHRIQLRWAGTSVEPRLEMRSRRRLKGVEVMFQVTSLFPAS